MGDHISNLFHTGFLIGRMLGGNPEDQNAVPQPMRVTTPGLTTKNYLAMQGILQDQENARAHAVAVQQELQQRAVAQMMAHAMRQAELKQQQDRYAAQDRYNQTRLEMLSRPKVQPWKPYTYTNEKGGRIEQYRGWEYQDAKTGQMVRTPGELLGSVEAPKHRGDGEKPEKPTIKEGLQYILGPDGRYRAEPIPGYVATPPKGSWVPIGSTVEQRLDPGGGMVDVPVNVFQNPDTEEIKKIPTFNAPKVVPQPMTDSAKLSKKRDLEKDVLPQLGEDKKPVSYRDTETVRALINDAVNQGILSEPEANLLWSRSAPPQTVEVPGRIFGNAWPNTKRVPQSPGSWKKSSATSVPVEAPSAPTTVQTVAPADVPAGGELTLPDGRKLRRLPDGTFEDVP